jgi:hypothetical protein
MLIVDAANVVGSVPNGWWRDRRGAATRLRDALAALHDGARRSREDDVILVVEGAARGVESIAGVRVVEAPGSGDDTIVDLVRELPPPVVVVTSDRALRARVESLGATTQGPRTLPYP